MICLNNKFAYNRNRKSIRYRTVPEVPNKTHAPLNVHSRVSRHSPKASLSIHDPSNPNGLDRTSRHHYIYRHTYWGTVAPIPPTNGRSSFLKGAGEQSKKTFKNAVLCKVTVPNGRPRIHLQWSTIKTFSASFTALNILFIFLCPEENNK